MADLCWKFKQSMWARNRVGVIVPALQATKAGGIIPWNLILGNSLLIPSLIEYLFELFPIQF
jgi:hypothetical protein